jgi:mono/diheme cytochrome c family protein
VSARSAFASTLAALCACSFACRPASRDMARQPRYEAMEANDFFADGGSARRLPQGVVARLAANDAHAPLLEELAPERDDRSLVDAATLARGRERYGIWCTPCHDWTGGGDGAVVRRGYPRAAAFTDQRMLQASDAHFLDVITNGRGKMPPYGPVVSPEDRRAIVAWIRVLLRCQNATLADAPAADRDRLLARKPERP